MVTDPPSTYSDDHLQDMLAQHLLQEACGRAHSPLLSHDHFKQFLSIASFLRVELCPKARHMLQSFYVGSRRMRSSSVHSSDMPNSALESMCALALAHARLSLRTQVHIYNIWLAIHRATSRWTPNSYNYALCKPDFNKKMLYIPTVIILYNNIITIEVIVN